jgi:hypothetical protein
MVTARRDGSVRALEILYDEFGPCRLVQDWTRLVSPIETSTTRDPVTLEVSSEQDVNGTTWGKSAMASGACDDRL